MLYKTINRNSTSQEIREASYKKVDTKDSRAYLFCKRFIDILSATFGMILLSPLFLVVSVLIKLEDKSGPVIFKQIRVGKDGREFYIYKFRSMIVDAEEKKASLMEKNEAAGPVFKIKEDPRVTRIGKFIRRTSIDELPQLFNVLIGDMSLVGPRPPLPDEVSQYNNYEKQRLMVVPGLTCYWQVSGRSNIGFDEWIELDLKYISERNLVLDIRLILKTVFVLFGSKDAF